MENQEKKTRKKPRRDFYGNTLKRRIFIEKVKEVYNIFDVANKDKNQRKMLNYEMTAEHFECSVVYIRKIMQTAWKMEKEKQQKMADYEAKKDNY